VLPVVLGKLDEMARLVDQMLDTARLEDSQLHLDVEPLDLGDLAAAAVARTPGSAHHRVVFDREDAPLICVADAARVLTTIANLLDNAVKYSPRGGEVRCTARREGGMAAVSVCDEGIGLDEAGMALLFTRFGRVPSRATAGIPGTGLGLYLARETARRHGGDVTVAAQPGAGSTFTLTLPLHRD
jgi:two-component system sensor histidine kinase SenX3